MPLPCLPARHGFRATGVDSTSMSEFRTSDGVRINFVMEGREDGPPLLFSNSLGTSLGMWDVQAKEAAGLGFRVIRYDQRGHGGSDAPEGLYTLTRLADDLVELLDGLGIDKAAFCGLSMGGMTGMHVAKRHPPRFTRMALCNTSAWMPGADMWNTRIQSVTAGGMEAVVDGVLERWFTLSFRQQQPEAVERVRAMILATPAQGYAGCCAAIRDMDERDRLGIIEAPALVVVGAHDPATPPDKGRYIVERIPGARMESIDAAHLSNIEQPAEFNRIVLGFLAGERP